MNEQLIVIDNLKEFKALSDYLKDYDFVAVDTETTGLSKRAEVIGLSIAAEETKAFYIILSEWSTELNTLEYLETLEYAKEFLDTLRSKKIIMHNAVFDCSIIESYFKIRLIDSLHTDTMVLAHLLNENRRVGLKELGAAIFGEDSTNEAKSVKESVIANGGLATKSNYEMFKADSQILAKYGAKDALLTFKLFTHLVLNLYDQQLDQFFYTDESMPLLKGPTYQLNTTGLQVDVKALATLKATLIAECAEAKSFIAAEIAPHVAEKYPGTNKKNSFNMGSNQHLSWLLFGQLSLEFGVLTKEGKNVCKAMGLKLPYVLGAKRGFIAECLRRVGQTYQPAGKVNGKAVRAKTIKLPWAYICVDKATLKKLAPKYRWIEALLGYQKRMKILSTYVEGVEERIQYGVIHPSYLQHGTTSGRYSSRNPNFQNLPRDDQRVKECIVARPGCSFVSADYSQLEPRVFAYYSQDPRLMQAFDGKTDFYSVIGIELYDKHDAEPIKEGSPNAFGIKYKKLRDSTKTIALARAYGATPPQLAKTLGKSTEDTAEDIAKYDERFPGVRKQMLEAHELAKANGFVTNLFGRPRRIPEALKIDKIYGKAPHEELPYEARQLLNLAVNHRIQSTGASIINRAAIAFYLAAKQAGIDCKIVSQVHDELIVECQTADAEDVSVLLRHCMENTTHLEGVPLEAIPRITRTLAK